MKNQKLQYLIVGKSTNFAQLLKDLAEQDEIIQLTHVVSNKKHIEKAFKVISGINIIFVSDDAHPPLNFIADLIRQYTPNTAVVIITQKTASTPLKPLFRGVGFAKLNVKNIEDIIAVDLLNIIQASKSNQHFKRCKNLLATAEQRNTWLIDSSSEAVAYISTNAHAYANTTYLALFGIDSLHSLHKVRPTDLIESDEAGVFQAFLKFQSKHHKLSHTLLLTMKSLKQSSFRVNLHAIPSVYKGKKCWQLWVHKIDQSTTENDRINNLRKETFQLTTANEITGRKNPFDELNKDLINKKEKADVKLILKGIVKRQEARLSAHKLVSLASQYNKKDPYHAHYILSLKVPIAQMKGVDDLLFSSPENNSDGRRRIFWDKVKVARLIQLLSKKSGLNNNYFITLSSESIVDQDFTRWILERLKSLGIKSRDLTIMIPSELDLKELKLILGFVKSLKDQQCKIALSDFTVKSNVVKVIRHIKPDFIRLSLNWVKEIESDESRQRALSQLLRQFEVKGISVIAPCSFSAEMRKMFVFSGVSFCQERTTKSA